MKWEYLVYNEEEEDYNDNELRRTNHRIIKKKKEAITG